MLKNILGGLFNNMLTNVRDWLDKMLTTKDIAKALNIEVSIDTDMWNAINLWSRMYRNIPPWKVKQQDYIKTLNLPAVISSKIAGNVTVEMSVKASGSPRAVYLETQFKKVLTNIQHIIEKGNALGGIIIKPYVRLDQIVFDYVMAHEFYPTSFDSDGNITGCVFLDRKKIGNFWFTRLEYHQMGANNTYRVYNAAFRSSQPDVLGGSVPLNSVEDWKALKDEVTIMNVTSPLFGYFKVPIANTIDMSSPLGMSCFAKSVDLIEQADRLWSDFLWEFESGKRAMYVDPIAMPADVDGNPFLPNKRLYRQIASASTIGDKNKMFEE